MLLVYSYIYRYIHIHKNMLDGTELLELVRLSKCGAAPLALVSSILSSCPWQSTAMSRVASIVCAVSLVSLRSQLLHPSCKHTTWCATTGCWCYCRTAKCFQRRSWVCRILEPNCHWRCPWTAGRCGHHPTSLGSRLGERRGRVPGQLHRLPCWWQQQHRGREEVEEGCPGDLRQVRCGCYHYSSHQRQRLHACLRRQAGPRWHWGRVHRSFTMSQWFLCTVLQFYCFEIRLTITVAWRKASETFPML